MIFYEPITPERLKDFKSKMAWLNQLLEQKHNMEKSAGLLKSLDLTKDKTAPKGKKVISSPEIYTLTLEQINKEIEHLKYHVFKTQTGEQYGLVEENKIISAQLARLSRDVYRTLLIKRYIEGQKHSVITYYFFCGQPDFTENYCFYLEKEKEWHKAALKQLAKISGQPYIDKCSK